MVAKSKSHLPTDRGWAWVIVVASFFNFFIMVGLAKSFGILVEQFIIKFDASTALATMVMSVNGIVYAVMENRSLISSRCLLSHYCMAVSPKLCSIFEDNDETSNMTSKQSIGTVSAPISIILGEHFTQRKVVMVGGFVGLIGISIGSLLISMSFVIGFIGVGMGIGNSTIFGNSFVMIGNYFHKRRTLANGLALAGSSIGQFTLPPLIQFLLDTYSLRGTLLILSAIYFNVMVCGALFRPISSYLTKTTTCNDVINKENNVISDRETTNQDWLLQESGAEINYDMKLRAVMASTGSILLQEDIEDDNVGHTNDVKKQQLSQCQKIFDFSVLRQPVSIFYVCVAFLCFVGYFNFILFLPLHAIDRGVEKYQKVMLISICGIGDLFGRLGSGFIGDLNLIARYKLMALSVIGVGVTILLFISAHSFVFMAVLSGIYGFFGGVYVNYNSIVIIDFVGLIMMPKLLALVLFFQGIGAAAGQPFLGWLKDTTGSFESVLYICGITPILGGIILLCYPLVKRKGRDNMT